MKNTILKIAGVKDEKSFYDLFHDEASFLKAYPKFALGGKMNIKAMQKFELGGKPDPSSKRLQMGLSVDYDVAQNDKIMTDKGYKKMGNTPINTFIDNNIYPSYFDPINKKVINYDGPIKKIVNAPLNSVDNPNSTTTKYKYQPDGINNLNIPFFKKEGSNEKFIYNKGSYEPYQNKIAGNINAQTMPQFASGGSIFKDIGAGLYGVGEGLLDTVTLGATDQITDMGYKALQKAGGSTEDEIREQDSIHGFSQAAGAIGGAVINPAGTGAAIGQTGKGLGEGISKGNESEEWARTTGQALNAAGAIGSIAYGNFGAAGTSGAANAGASAAGNASKLTGQSAKFAGSDFGKFAQTAGKYGSIAGQMGSVLQPMFNQQYGNNQGYKMGGQMQYAMGGMNVQPNAEIELTEGTKDGYSIRSHDLNSHENATEANDVFLNGGSKVLSTRLIDPDTKEPFSNSTIDTKKYEKTINDPKASLLSKETATKMINVAGIIFDKSFAKQELLKQQMASSAFDRMVKKYGVPPQLKNAQPSQYNEQIPQGMPGQSQGKMAMGGIQESDYQTDPGKLSDIQRQLKVVKQQISTLQPDSSFVSGPLAKLRGLEKDLTIRQNNHPEFKKAMGGKLPMYQDGAVVPASGSSNYFNTPSLNNESINQYKFQQFLNNKERGFSAPQSTFNPYSVESWKFQQQLDKDGALYGNSAELVSDQYTPAQNWNAQGLAGKINPNAGSPSGNTQGNLGVQGPPKIEGKGFDYKKAAGNLGQFALQNAGNIYDLYRSTQDNSKLNLARYSPELLSAEKSLFDNQRMYSEGKRQTAEASGGNASTYLGNLGALRGQKMAADLDTRVQFGNINAQIANAAKLYNAGAIDKETMFKLQAEGMNRNLKGQGLTGISQNLINQQNTDRKFASEAEAFAAMEGQYDTYFKIKKAKEARLAAEKAKGELG